MTRSSERSQFRRGGTVSIPVRFSIGGYESVATASVKISYCSATAEQETRQQNVRALKLLVSAHVTPDFRVTPLEINFGEIDGLTTQSVSQVVHIEPEALDQLELHGIRLSVDELSAEVQPPSHHSQKGCDVVVSLDVSHFKSSQVFSGNVILETNSRRVSSIIIPVDARYLSPVSVQPSSVEVESNVKGDVERKIHIITSMNSRIVQADAERVAIKYDNRQQSTEHEVVLAVPPCSAEPLITVVKLQIQLYPKDDDKAVREVSIPVYRFFSKKELQDDKKS